MIDKIQNIELSKCSNGNCSPQTREPEPQPKTHPSQPEDTVRISKEGKEQLKGLPTQATGITGEGDLGEEQKREVEKLKKRDREVKSHEQAHMAAGSGVVIGGANYEYQSGPDGKMYAVGGEVKIDTSREKDPAQTISKMQQVRRAALAPAQPSAQDRSVAAQAAQIEAEARSELANEKAEAAKEEDALGQFSDQVSSPASASQISTVTKTPYNPTTSGSYINIVI